jgi:hypothetical protein
MPNRLWYRKFIDVKQKKIFKFNPALSTFTAAMAKRKFTGPFAGAPFVQGTMNSSGTSDILSFPRGNQVVGFWYSNLDPYQGSISFWVTPEWNGNDGFYHTFISETSIPIKIAKKSDNRLYLNIGLQSVSADASTWTAGTTYYVVARWDTKNTLDGTNYLCISINDVHTFGATTAPIPTTPSAVIYIGSSNGAEAGNAGIQGLCWVRRVLFDNTYGIDISNGDEIALAYSGGA